MNPVLNHKKVIFFDVGYTLDYPASGDWVFTNRFLRYAGEKLRSLSPDRVLQAKLEGMDWLEKHHLMNTPEEESDRLAHYYGMISDRLGLGLAAEEIRDCAEDRTRNMANYIAYPDAEKVLKILSVSFRLGIISDTWPSISNQLTALGLMPYFSFHTYSFELGVFKPDPRMFEDALVKAGCAAGETVFIDDVPKNLDAAAKLGITPILIAANPASDVDTPYLKIRSLSELI